VRRLYFRAWFCRPLISAVYFFGALGFAPAVSGVTVTSRKGWSAILDPKTCSFVVTSST